ncbi:MAG: hypothetical protein IJL91_05695 [Bacteroidales bacterium]|nr:hypothetical protein [Bacteroidales bacterium]
MAMQLRYAGEFLSVRNDAWRCEILQESESAFIVGDLVFPADEPLVIEWEGTELEEPLCGSSATLKIESPGDRTYMDLYSVRAGNIKLNVFRNGSLFWSGTLDTEFYEEPYDRGSRYDVTLTFSDFGILDRKPFDLSGENSLAEIVSSALSRSGISYRSIRTCISSEVDGGTLTLSSLLVRSQNFFDETDEPMTYREVLEGILQPLALRMIQKDGTIFIYDLNGLYGNPSSSAIVWDGTGSVLGTGRVYNNVKVTFSPYAKAELLDGETEYTGTCDRKWAQWGEGNTYDVKYDGGDVPSGMTTPDCYSFFAGYYNDDESDFSAFPYQKGYHSFTVFLSDEGKGVEELGPYAKYARILAVNGGEDHECIMRGFVSGGLRTVSKSSAQLSVHSQLNSEYPRHIGENMTLTDGSVVFRSKKVLIPWAGEEAKAYLRMEVPMLVDPRYNPFEESGEENEKGNYEDFEKVSEASVKCSIVLYDANGTALYHYENEAGTEQLFSSGKVGSWIDGDDDTGLAWLSYYDPDKMGDGQAVLGWKNNRHHHNYYSSGNKYEKYIHTLFRDMPDGLYMPYPPTGGYLQLTVYDGISLHTVFSKTEITKSIVLPIPLFYYSRWAAFKAPELSIVSSDGSMKELTSDDAEYTGILNADARESLAIDTICGTLDEACVSSRGLYLLPSGEALKTMSRAGRTHHPEQLLIGTLYSQYADRKTTLSGETESDYASPHLFTDDAQPGDRLFITQAEVMYAREGTSRSTILEIRPDEYDDEN